MKQKKIITQLGINQFSWLNPLVLAFVPTLIILLLKPVDFKKYNCEYVFDRAFSVYVIVNSYVDFQNDNKKEKIQIVNDKTGKGGFVLHDENNRNLGQFILKKSIANFRRKTHCFDVVQGLINHTKALIIYTTSNDSLFLNVFDYTKQDYVITDKFISTFGGYRNAKDVNINPLPKFDSNNDGFNEHYFTISTGYGLYPRQVFKYEYKTNEIIRSINTGASNIIGKLAFTNNSHTLAITCSANGNCPPDYPYPYHDTTVWLMLFDKDLNLIKEPLALGKYPAAGNIEVIDSNRVLFMCSSNNLNIDNTIYMFNSKGELIRKHAPFSEESLELIKFNHKSKDFLILSSRNKMFYELNTNNLETKPCVFLSNIKNKQIIEQTDINHDNKLETISYNFKNKCVEIYSNNLKLIADAKVADNEMGIELVSTRTFQDAIHLLINGNKNYYEFTILKNPYYWLRVPFACIVYLLSIFFIAFIMFFQNRRFENKQKLEKQIASLQLQNLRNQLDPHFTFNALNSVGNAIYKQEKDAAYDLFQRFTRMVRSSLLTSDTVFRTLDEELQFTLDYLEFQKTRFKNRFDYKFDIDKTLNLPAIEIPKMLIQGFAENAVKHAFYGIDYTGLITIGVKKEKEAIVIIVEDNGIGIEKSKELKATSGTQKGLSIVKEQIIQINKLYKKNLTIKTIDNELLIPKKKGTTTTTYLQ